MHALLYLEELQQETDIRFYDIEEAQLSSNKGQLLFLEVRNHTEIMFITCKSAVLWPIEQPVEQIN